MPSRRYYGNLPPSNAGRGSNAPEGSGGHDWNRTYTYRNAAPEGYFTTPVQPNRRGRGAHGQQSRATSEQQEITTGNLLEDPFVDDQPPTPATQVGATLKLPPFDPSMTLQNFDDGSSSFYCSRRWHYIPNDNIESVVESWEGAVMSVYGAIRDAPNDPNPSQQEMYEEFNNHIIEKLETPQETVVQVAHMVVSCLKKLHTYGDHLRSDEIDEIGPTTEDLTMVASVRLERVIKALKSTKDVVSQSLSGADYITKLVAAPIAMEQRAIDKKRDLSQFID